MKPPRRPPSKPTKAAILAALNAQRPIDAAVITLKKLEKK